MPMDMRKQRLTFEEISAPLRATGSALSARGVGERSGNEGEAANAEEAAMTAQEEAHETCKGYLGEDLRRMQWRTG